MADKTGATAMTSLRDEPRSSTEAACRTASTSEATLQRVLEESHTVPMTPTRLMTLVGMAFLWTSAQIPVYLWGGIPAIVYGALGGSDRWVWLITGHLLASAAVCPFVGALSDELGRRPVALLGCALLVVGQLVCTCATGMNMFIAGMVVSGAGAGLNELTALAGASEMAPTAQRGAYVAALITSVLPFSPSVLWAQLLAAHAGWRAVGVLTTVYGAATFILIAVFYHPPPRVARAAHGPRAWWALLQRLDWPAGILSTAGVVLLVAGLLWGGYPYSWGSAHVVAPLVVGALLLVGLVVWEVWWVRPGRLAMVPARLFRGRAVDGIRSDLISGAVSAESGAKAGVVRRAWRRLTSRSGPRTMALALVVAFVSGANFFSVLMLWPSQAYNVYGHDPVGVGLRGLPFATGVVVGCVAGLVLLSRCRGGNRPLLVGASALMTAGCGALASAQRDRLAPLFVLLALAGLGVGAIMVAPSLVVSVVCPHDLIATANALTLAVRVAGGAVGYSIYYNVFVHHLVPQMKTRLGTALAQGLAASNSTATVASLIGEVIGLTSAGQTEALADLPGVDAALAAALVDAGQLAYAAAYPYVYYVSIAFGVISMGASLFMDDIRPYMDNHVAVVIA